jgi:hypothetical protein
VGHLLVAMLVLVALRQMKPDAEGHEGTGCNDLDTDSGSSSTTRIVSVGFERRAAMAGVVAGHFSTKPGEVLHGWLLRSSMAPIDLSSPGARRS